MKFMVSFIVSLFPIGLWAHDYEGLPSEAETLTCAKAELLSASSQHPLPLKQIDSIRNKNYLPFLIRPTSKYAFVARDEKNGLYSGYIIVSNHTRKVNDRYITNCRIDMPSCRDFVFDHHTLLIKDTSKSTVSSRWNRSCVFDNPEPWKIKL